MAEDLEEEGRLGLDPLKIANKVSLLAPLGRLFEIAIQIVILVALALLLGTLKPYVESYMGDYDYDTGYGTGSGTYGYYPASGYDVGTSGSSYATTGSQGGHYKRSVDTPLVQRLSARVSDAIESFEN